VALPQALDLPSAMNLLYYGDNRDILPRHVKDEIVDLVYLDPPFKSDRNFNVLFAERDGTDAAAQIKVFEDTWRWNAPTAALFDDVVERGGRVHNIRPAPLASSYATALGCMW
jgi:hypothetical protein